MNIITKKKGGIELRMESIKEVTSPPRRALSDVKIGNNLLIPAGDQQWEYEVKRGVWATFNEEANVQLVRSVALNQTVKVKVKGTTFTVDFKRMTHKPGMGRERRVRVRSKSSQERRKCMKFKISANNLINVDTFGLSDPYLLLSQGEKILYQSEVVDDNLNPTWRTFEIFYDTIDERVPITFKVYDYEVIEKDQVLGQVDLTVNQLRHFTSNKAIPLADESGQHIGECGKLRFHACNVLRASVSQMRRGSTERPSPYLVQIVGRDKHEGHIVYFLRVIAPLADTRKPIQWKLIRKFGTMSKFYDKIKNHLGDRKVLIRPFPPRPRNIFGHSQKFLNERQALLNGFWDSLCKAIPSKMQNEPKDLTIVRERLYSFLEIEKNMEKFRTEIREEKERYRASVENFKKAQGWHQRNLSKDGFFLRKISVTQSRKARIEEQKQKLKEFKRQQFSTVKEKLGLGQQWRLQKIDPDREELRKIKDLTVFLSTTPGDTLIRKYTLALVNLFKTMQIKFEIRNVAMDKKSREWMLENSKAKEWRKTPQVFKGKQYLGQYPDIREAHRMGRLFEFLITGKLPEMGSENASRGRR
eukprot:CAMPEP_0167750802 /NCGR_PEP_ID=MMETSP0110_2-20121227/6195_1 /TAXON_ID=629695 /ORGANISM="Gymnochlora sp., Strain CCMP2014" /LENGTH=584 /DNA_ID=CAMNT_0007636167 /DNA_START=1 /DNA_END=1755 /DNA_ORIENTATION=-